MIRLDGHELRLLAEVDPGQGAELPDPEDLYRRLCNDGLFLTPRDDRARPYLRRSRVGAGLVIVGIGAALVAGVAVAGVSLPLIDLFQGSKPPPQVVALFESLPSGAPSGMDPQLLDGKARQVTSFGAGKNRVALWAGPSRTGYCYLVESTAGGCRQIAKGARPTLDPTVSLPSPGAPFTIIGSIDTPNVDRVIVSYADGSIDDAAVARVGDPISATFFYLEVPRRHWAENSLPASVTAIGPTGNEIAHTPEPLVRLSARDRELISKLRH